MQHTNLQYQIALTLLNGIGPKRARHLIASCGGLNNVMENSFKELHLQSGLSISLLRATKRKEALEQAETHALYLQKNDIKSHFYLESSFSRRLKQCDDAPLLLFSKGTFDLNASRIISVVGTRNATDYGKKLCEELIDGIKGKDIIVASGLAYGIDIYVHRLCVQHGVPTIGVLGHGLDRIYPMAHRRTAMEMCENGGLLTEFLPQTNPDRENFPMRNRIVAGMCDATLVVESKKSGGSLITADLAFDYQRDVFAYPGNIHQAFSEGCNLLIQNQKAHLIRNSEDFLRIMDWTDANLTTEIQKPLFASYSPEEQNILNYLQTKGEQHVDYIAADQKQSPGKLNFLLLQLEMQGALKCLPGNRYRIA